MTEPEPPSPVAGSVESRVRDEFPGLRLDWVPVTVRSGRSPPALVRRLRDLSNRYRGSSVVAMRTRPIPQAFRVFFRQIGLDPDVTRIPSEDVAVARLLHGGFRSAGRLPDAVLVALIETGVPVWALDATVIDTASLGIRMATVEDARHGGGRRLRLSPGSLVVADATAVHAPLFGEPIPGHGAGPHTARAILFAVGVDGVPAIHVEESLWICLQLLG